MRSQHGISYLEMMIVVVILGIVAAVAVPGFSSVDPKKLDVAAQAIADAVDFARAESIRRKMSHGVNFDAAGQRIRVYSLPAETAVYDVYHPVDKKIYDIRLTSDEHFVGVSLDSVNFSFDGTSSSSSNLEFSADGIPKYSGGVPRRDYLLSNGEITLSFHEWQRTISVAPATGRVKVQ